MPRQRGETWEHQETILFLRLFGESEVQEQLNSCHRNQAVYEDLAERMNDHGYIRTPHQLRIKAKDLKKRYRHLKKKNQPNKEHAFWRYYCLLDSIVCHDHNAGSEAVTSSAAKKEDEHSEGGGSASQPPDEVCLDKSQDPGLPTYTLRTSRRLSDASFVASAMRPSAAQKLQQHSQTCWGCDPLGGSWPDAEVESQGLLQRSPARAAVRLAKTRARKSKSMTEFNKVFLQCNRNIERFQQIFQDQTDMQRREREKIQREASRTTKETKAAASQMREAVLIQAAAINRVADAINRYSDLLECFSLEPSPRTGKPSFQDDSSMVDSAPGQKGSCLSADWFSKAVGDVSRKYPM